MSEHPLPPEPSSSASTSDGQRGRSIWLVPIPLVLALIAYFVWRHYQVDSNLTDAELLARVHDVDQTARGLYELELNSVAAGGRTHAQLAALVREQIIPDYEQLTADLQAFVPRDAREAENQASLLDYVALVTDGWELLAEARERQNFIREGESIEKFEAARDILASLGVEVEERERNMYAEIALLLLADHRAETGFAERFQSNDQTDTETADAVARDVVPDWEHAVQRFTSAAVSPPAQYQRSVGQLLHYAELRTEAFRLALESLRESDEAKTAQAAALLAEARDIQAEIMQQGLVE